MNDHPGYPHIATCLGDLIERELERVVMIRPPEFQKKMAEVMVANGVVPTEEAMLEATETSDEIARAQMAEMLYTCTGLMGLN